MLDITYYYNTYLKDKKIAKVNSGITGIISREEFSFLKKDEMENELGKIKEEKKKQEEFERKRENERKLEELMQERENLEQEKRNAKRKALENLKKAIQEFNEFSDSSDHFPKMVVDEKDILISVEDHFEISSNYLFNLKMIDLKYISFDHAKVDGIDFRGTNLTIDPQKVYKKSLKGCNFEKIYISPFMNFKGVDIRGCHFTSNEDQSSYDSFNVTFKDSIYDETTTYNGVSFVKIIEEDTIRKNR